MIRFGGKEPVDIVIGGKVVSSISMNGDVVWQKAPGINYFYIENTDFRSGTLKVKKVGSPTTGSDLSFSTDGVNFDVCTYDNNEFSVKVFNTGDKVYFRSTTGFSQNYTNYYYFSANFEHIVGGDITTLSNYNNNSLNYIEVPRLFYNDSFLLSAANLDCSKITEVGRMDSTHAPRTCSWEEAFYNCSNMTTPPDFQNVTLVKQYGFYSTFEGCTNMTTPPNMSRVSSAFRMGYVRTFAWCENLAAGPNFNNINTIEIKNIQHYGTFEETFTSCYVLQDVYAPNVIEWYENTTIGTVLNNYTAKNWLDDVGNNGVIHTVSSSLVLPDSVSGCPTTAYGWSYSSI